MPCCLARAQNQLQVGIRNVVRQILPDRYVERNHGTSEPDDGQKNKHSSALSSNEAKQSRKQSRLARLAGRGKCRDEHGTACTILLVLTVFPAHCICMGMCFVCLVCYVWMY